MCGKLLGQPLAHPHTGETCVRQGFSQEGRRARRREEKQSQSQFSMILPSIFVVNLDLWKVPLRLMDREE